MNSKSISHHLFVAALQPSEPTPPKRPAAVRHLAGPGAASTNAVKTARSLSALASQRVADWSWSGWQQNTI